MPQKLYKSSMRSGELLIQARENSLRAFEGFDGLVSFGFLFLRLRALSVSSLGSMRVGPEFSQSSGGSAELNPKP